MYLNQFVRIQINLHVNFTSLQGNALKLTYTIYTLKYYPYFDTNIMISKVTVKFKKNITLSNCAIITCQKRSEDYNLLKGNSLIIC